MKELKYHPIYYDVILSTASDGFHIFKPALDDVNDDESEEDPKEIPKIKESELD